MSEAIIMLLATVVVWHAIARLSVMPSILRSKWRQKALSLSIITEFTGALMAFFGGYMGKNMASTIIVLLIAIVLTALADQRLSHRVVWKKEGSPS